MPSCGSAFDPEISRDLERIKACALPELSLRALMLSDVAAISETHNWLAEGENVTIGWLFAFPCIGLSNLQARHPDMGWI